MLVGVLEATAIFCILRGLGGIVLPTLPLTIRGRGLTQGGSVTVLHSHLGVKPFSFLRLGLENQDALKATMGKLPN